MSGRGNGGRGRGNRFKKKGANNAGRGNGKSATKKSITDTWFVPGNTKQSAELNDMFDFV